VAGAAVELVWSERIWRCNPFGLFGGPKECRHGYGVESCRPSKRGLVIGDVEASRDPDTSRCTHD